jgi:hypothetical protein
MRHLLPSLVLAAVLASTGCSMSDHDTTNTGEAKADAAKPSKVNQQKEPVDKEKKRAPPVQYDPVQQ